MPNASRPRVSLRLGCLSCCGEPRGTKNNLSRKLCIGRGTGAQGAGTLPSNASVVRLTVSTCEGPIEHTANQVRPPGLHTRTRHELEKNAVILTWLTCGASTALSDVNKVSRIPERSDGALELIPPLCPSRTVATSRAVVRLHCFRLTKVPAHLFTHNSAAQLYH